MTADRTLRFVVSGEQAFGPIARRREADVAPGGVNDLDQHVAEARWAEDITEFADAVLPLLRERGLWAPPPVGDLRSRLGLVA